MTVKGLDSVAHTFFNKYVREGRRDYPIDKMGDHYELALLYAYYMKKISDSKYLAKMSGRDGITTVQSIMDAYSAADLRSMEFNRQILDAELKEPGKGGVKAFTNLIDRDDDLTFTEDVTSSGFESPFADGRTVKIADFIKSVLGEADNEELPSASETPAA